MTDRHLSFSGARAVLEHEMASVVFIVVVIFLVGADFFNVALGGGVVTASLKLLMMFPMIFWVGRNTRFLLRGLMAVPELSAMLALVLLSVLWSAYPGITLERLFPLFVTTSAAITLGSKVSLRTLIIALGILAAITVISSFVAVATIPSARGIPPWDTTWRGVFNHKNGLGSSCMFMLIYSSSAAILCQGRARTFFLLVAAGAGLLLVESESRTSQVIATISMTALLVGVLYRRWALIWGIVYILFVTGAVALASFLFASSSADPVFELIGREPTLSGRLPLWAETWPNVTDRLWLGHGYSAFWDPESRAVIEIARNTAVGYIPYYSHSGLIETLLNTGVIGTALFAILLIRLIVTVFSGFRLRAGRPALIAAQVIVIAFILLNITESSILSRESLTWMGFVAVATKLGNIAKADRRSAAGRPATAVGPEPVRG